MQWPDDQKDLIELGCGDNPANRQLPNEKGYSVWGGDFWQMVMHTQIFLAYF